MTTTLVQDIARKTQAGAISFPEAVRALLADGVESYHVDYTTRRKTFHGGDGAVATAEMAFADLPPVAADFDAAALRAAIRDSQQNGQRFHDFSRRATAAGVQGYFAFLRGQRVVYFGRQGDLHTEWFPGARPAAQGS